MGRYYCNAKGCRYYDDDCFQNLYYCNKACIADFIPPDQVICHDCMLNRLKKCPQCDDNRCTFCLPPGKDMCEQCEESLGKEGVERVRAENAKKGTKIATSSSTKTTDAPKKRGRPKKDTTTPVKSSQKSVTKPRASKASQQAPTA
jgi:hypothetical protein